MGRYLKSFMEANITDEFLSELKDFCEMNLVYLMDDGLQVSVVKHPIFNGRAISLPRDNFDFDTYLSCVTLRYPLAPGTFELLVQKDWNSVKDQLIPFFTRLEREYNVITFDQLPIAQSSSLFGQGINNTSQVQFGLRRRVLVNPTLSNGGFRKNFTVDDVISDRLDLGNNLIVEIRFYVSCNDEVIVPVKKRDSRGATRWCKRFLGFNESVGNLQDELDDLCDTCLSPLVDDGFSYEVTPTWNGEFVIRLSKLESNGLIPELYDYTEVMDRFIPLVRMLSTRYDMSEWIYFYTTQEWDINKKVFTVDQISSDKGPGFLITSVKLTVKGNSSFSPKFGWPS